MIFWKNRFYQKIFFVKPEIYKYVDKSSAAIHTFGYGRV